MLQLCYIYVRHMFSWVGPMLPYVGVRWPHVANGARLSGVSLLNPGAGHGPVSLPEAFGGNRRLYTLAPPAADPFVGPPVYPRSTPGRIRSTDVYVSCGGCSKNVQKHCVLQCFVAFGVHDFRLTGRRWCRLCVPRGQA